MAYLNRPGFPPETWKLSFNSSTDALYCGLEPTPTWLFGRVAIASMTPGRSFATKVASRWLLGEMVHVGGGVYADNERAFVAELIGEPIDSRCPAEGYWLVSEFLP